MIDWKAMLEPEEWVVGIVFGLAFTHFLGAWVFLAAPLCGLLWRLGGVHGGDKLFRRIGVPLTLGSCLVFSGALFPIYALLSAVVGFAVLSIGYGIPDATDEGSALGRFWLSILKVANLADAATRATVGALFGVAWATLAWVSPIWWVGVVLFLAVAYPVVEEYVE